MYFVEKKFFSTANNFKSSYFYAIIWINNLYIIVQYFYHNLKMARYMSVHFGKLWKILLQVLWV